MDAIRVSPDEAVMKRLVLLFNACGDECIYRIEDSFEQQVMISNVIFSMAYVIGHQLSSNCNNDEEYLRENIKIIVDMIKKGAVDKEKIYEPVSKE